MKLFAALCNVLSCRAGSPDGSMTRRTLLQSISTTLCVAGSCAFAGCATNLGSGPSTTAALTTDPKRTDTPSAPQKPVRIAMLLPLSGFGPTAATAKGMKQAGELALFELDNPLVQLIVKDDHGTPEGAATAASEALSDGAEIIIGPLTARATSAVAPIARKANVAIVSFSNDRSIAGNGVYLIADLPEQEIDRVVTYAASQGKRRFAAIIPDDAYGNIIEGALRTTTARISGASVDLVGRFPSDSTSMLPPVRQFMDAVKVREDSGIPIDTLLLTGSPEALEQLCPVISFAGLDSKSIKVIGTSSWDFPNAGRNAVLVGGWYPGPDPHSWQDFAQRFSRSFGSAPPKLASLSYDAVSLAIALSGYEPGKRYTPETMTRTAGFQGISGVTRFGANGLPQRSLSVLELQTFGSSAIDTGSPQIAYEAKQGTPPQVGTTDRVTSSTTTPLSRP